MLGLLHTHSENSLKECPLLIGDILDAAKERGYGAVALTDHGSMTGIAEFINTAMKKGIKPVPGVELDILVDGNTYELILMAKDYTGYVGLCKAVSDANRMIPDGIPILPWENLKEWFGMGSPYYGHVAASSGGIKGELMQAACYRLHIREQARENSEKQKAAREAEKQIPALDLSISKTENELDALEKERGKAALRAGKNFSKKEEMARRLLGREREDAFRKIEAEKADSQKADRELQNIRDRIARRKKKLVELCQEKRKLQEKASHLTDTGISQDADLIPDGYLVQRTADTALKYQAVFGDGDFYIELMNHGTREEAEALQVLAAVAQKTGIPAFLSNDVHILNDTEEDVLRWQLIRSLEGNQWAEMEQNAGFYYMRDEQSLTDMFIGLIPDEVVDRALVSMHEFFDGCTFEWPKEKHYPKYTDPKGRTADQALAEEARANIPRLFQQGEWTAAHEERLNAELPTIQKTGYSDYTLILSEILEEGRKGRHEDLPGSFIGPGRGSGAGSLVNYLMGITRIDPLKYDLIFERYLNVERISPPDIDSDIATSVRDMLVQYIVKRYSSQQGRVGVCGIITKSRLTAKAAIKAAGRVLSARMYGNAAKLYTVADKISKAVPNELHMTLDKCMDILQAEFYGDTEMEIIHYAQLMEGLLAGYGTHAAGVIITDNGDVTDYAPIRNMGTTEEPIWNIQYDKEESERIGLLKLDALGLTALDVISNTLQRIYRTSGKWIDIDRIPFEKKVFTEIYGKGRTNGVFQCESPGMKRLWMQMKPDCIEDIIAGVALYRPGPMDFIPDYIRGKKNPGSIQYLAPQLKPILENTYGCIVYQEQVMRIVRDLAGYSMGRSDLVRRAMSKKKAEIMDAERKNFVYGNGADGIPGCVARGIPAETAEKIYALMVDFAKYAFNKSHAAAYAIVSYQTAWLKYHYPKEFLIETLNQAAADDIPMFIEECRRYGFEVLPPDINRSAEGFSESGGKILYGIGSVKGVKKNAHAILQARGNGFPSFAHFALSGCANKAVTKALIKAGAFQVFCNSRVGLLAAADKITDMASRVRSLKKRCVEKQAQLNNGVSARQKERLMLSLRRDETDIKTLTDEIKGFPMPGNPDGQGDDSGTVLDMEKATLFTYISFHPLDQYDPVPSDPIRSMDALEYPCEMRVCGVVSALRPILTKKKKEMCVFNLEDKTGTAKVVCWPEPYAQFKEFIRNGAVILVDADAKQDTMDGESWTLFVKRVSLLESRVPETVVEAENREGWERKLKPEAMKYVEKQGSRLLVYFKNDGTILVTDFYVNSDILNSGIRCSPVRRRIGIKQKGGKNSNG